MSEAKGTATAAVAGGYPGEEVFAAEHPIRHVFVAAPGATRLALVFSGFERAHRPRYNYIERLAPLPLHRLHVLDDMGSRGCYYLGRDRDFFVARAIAALVDERLDEVGLTRADVVTVGSSKGGTAALYHALAFDYGEAIAAAPQVLLARYLTETVSARDVSTLIAGGDTPEDHRFLDRVLLDTTAASPYRPRLHFFISPHDPHRRQHLEPLLRALDAKGHAYTVALGDYATHSAVGVPFAAHVLERLRAEPARPAGAPSFALEHRAPGPGPGDERSDRFLYRGGFLVHETRRRPTPRAADLARRLAEWHEVAVGRFTLRYDESWPCSRAAVGETEVVLLGTATHVDRPEAGHDELTGELARALARSQVAFYDLLDHLSGAHVVLARTGDRHVLLQDATGMEAVFYDVADEARLCSSHPGLIAELEGYEVSEFAQAWLADPRLQAGGAYFPGVLTPFAELRVLTPNTQLDLDTGAVERFFPREPLGTRPLEEVVEEVARRLRNQWHWLMANHEVAVSLTAGLDSRLTLAASRAGADRARYFTYSVWGNRFHAQDCATATRLAARLGLDHEVYRVPRGEPLDPDLDAVWERMYAMRGGQALTNAYLSRFPAGHLHVRSNVLETVRGFYLKNPANVPDRFDTAKLSRLFRSSTATEFEGAFADFERVTAFSRTTKLDFHYSDLYYWEHRLGAWHSGVVSRSKPSHPTFVLYNSRQILTAMLAVPLADRVAAVGVWALMDALWPEILEEPIMGPREPLTRPR